ncbi:AAA family ATPase [Aquibacillus albus]|uniref:ATPase/DNA-binding CsgD family transcriptional regulator/GAF domain-containing protein n=1 Tax=Aquibacillus albus TaxID=1168171 RepID=A0ABS2N5Q4_9BACI|nr:AAA family ATPase [Aquibacillus albus]MBM7573471.1 putative ATPase/DNA-binding CsgD family transcriptional regulator/GAF domain-containing protein [Aquibacillus albus]
MSEWEEIGLAWRLGDFDYVKALHVSSESNVLLRKEIGNSNHSSVQLKKELREHLRLKLPNVLHPKSVVEDGLVFEYAEGRPIIQALKHKELSTTDTLDIAIQLVETLHEFHKQKNIHFTVIPEQIILKNNKQIKILPLPYMEKQLHSKYQAPEAIIHKGKNYDERSDLYKLGLLLYELFTNGKDPFPGNKDVDWRHNHIAVEPIPLTRMNRMIPKMINNIVVTLLQKNPEKRYQCSEHLAKDLFICLKELSELGTIQPFRLSLGSFSGDFSIPTAFYGREKEINDLYDVFQRAAFGSTELVMLSGSAGIGKTTLVKNQFKSMIQNRAYFGYGKFDQLHKNIPYTSLIDAFRGIITQILMQSNDQVEEWKNSLQQALGKNGRILTDVIPELVALVGEQPPVEVLSDRESENRFVQVFNKFVQVFASVDHPLVLFLDDIHWADYGSLRLIYSLLTDSHSQRFLVIASCRHHEIEAFDKAYERHKGIDKYGVGLTELELPNLSIAEVEQFVVDTLECEFADCRGLARLVYRKTAGNPFYMKQLLRLIHSKQWIQFDAALQKWKWDELAIQAVKDQDHIIEHMVKKIHQSPANLTEVLKKAACLGNGFYEEDLERFSSFSLDELKEGLLLAQQEGLILAPNSDHGHKRYQFFHDRIQQIAYSFIDETEKQTIHLAIGRFLSQMIETDNVLFKTVNHYNRGKALITNLEEKEKLLRLNHQAARKAKSSAAYDTAEFYYRNAISFIDVNKWIHSFTYCYQLYLELSNIEYLCGNIEQAKSINQELLGIARNWEEAALVYKQKITKRISQGNYKEAMEIGLQCLRDKGIHIAASPDEETVKRAIKQTKSLFPSGFESLRDIPDVTDTDMKIAMDILFELMVPAFFHQRDVFILLIHTFIELILEHGKVDIAPAVYAAYGVLLCAELDEVEKSYEIGKIAVELADQEGFPSVQCKVYVLFGGVICQWYKDGTRGESYLKKAIDLGLSVGDYVYTGMAVAAHINTIYTWKSLDQMIDVNKKHLGVLEQIKDSYTQNSASAYIQFARCLQGLTDNPLTLNDTFFNEDQFIKTAQLDDRGRYTLFQYYTYKMQICFIHGSYRKAVEYAKQAENYLQNVQHLTHYGEYLFYKALAILQAWYQWDGAEQKQLLRDMAKILRQFSFWRQNNSMAFEHKEWLLRAEYARMQDFPDKADLLYKHAIESAKKSQYGRNLAIAYELAGRFYLQFGKESEAKHHLEKAVVAYTKWGAKPKATAIKETYPEYFGVENVDELPDETENNPVLLQHELEAYPMTNLGNIMKASESLSEEMDFNYSLKELMFSVKRESLAEKGVLFTKEADEIIVTAIVKGTTEFSFLSQRMEESNEVPQQIVRFVDRTKQVFIIDDIAHHEAYHRDPYIRKQMPRSILCLPLMIQGQYKGILYLENRWIANLFSDELANVVKYLGTQAMFVTRLLETFNSSEPKREPSTAAIEEANPEMMIFDELTDRELEIINLMAAGLSNQEIARTLGLKVGTIKVHNHNIFSKLDVNRRTKAVFKAKELKLIDRM